MYDNLAQATIAVTDPATTPRDLMAIAQAYPNLWAGVAKHPNAYPDLLTWLTTVGDDTVRAAVVARTAAPDTPPPPPVATETIPPEEAIPETKPSKNHGLSWISTRKGKRILIGSGAGLLAVILTVVLIVNLVVIPHQRAEEAAAAASASAAAEQARLDEEHQAAVVSFTNAVHDCTQANTSLANSLAHAQYTAATDPSTLDNPNLIDGLNQAIASAQTVEICTPPTMADDTASIQQQTAQLTTDTDILMTSVRALTNADDAVTTSVQTKENKEAAAKKAEQDAAYAAAHTASVTLTDSDGYARKFTITISDWIQGTNTSALAATWTKFGGTAPMPLVDGSYSLGQYSGNVDFTQADAAYVFGKVSVENASPGYDVTKYSGNNPALIAPAWNSSYENKWSVQCIVYSSKTDCGVNKSQLVTPLMESNNWGPVPFVMALNGAIAKTPNNPNGNPDFDNIVLNFGLAGGRDPVQLTPVKFW